MIAESVLDDDELHNIVCLGYDPYGATQLAVKLAEKGIDVLEIPQRTAYLSEPMKWIEALVIDGRLHHTGCPLMNWMMSNVMVKPDANDNIFPRKDRDEMKIDGAVALIIAKAVEDRFEPKRSVYEDRGVRML